jgi:hypothetical protein
MATNEKNQNNNNLQMKAAAKAPIKAFSEVDNSDISDTVQNAGVILNGVYNSIVADEAARDATIDQTESAAIAAHMKILEDCSIPAESKKEILEMYYERIDKKRTYETDNKKENTKRLSNTLWAITISVLGVTGIKYLPKIIEAYIKNKKV